jgi:glutamine synthetase
VSSAEELAGAGVHGVVLAYVDTAGIARVKTVPVARLAAAAAHGVGMSPVFDAFLAHDGIATTQRIGTPDGDIRLVPDLDRVVVLPAQPGWAWAPVDRLTQDGERHPGCSRSFLRAVVADAEQVHGLRFRAAIEIEWALSRLEADGFDAAVSGPAYGATRLVEVSDYAAELLATLAAQGADVEQLHPEYAAGQFELSVGALDPVAAADLSVLVRQTVQAVSRRHRMRASFSPAYLPGGVGNGGHLHLSAWQDGRNLHAGGDRRHGMTAQAEAFAAGILGHLPGLAAICAPSPASYLRLQPSRWSGPFTAWGLETREAAIRLVRGMVGRRDSAANLELKPVDLAANPYLMIGCVIAAGLDGLMSRAELPQEITGDPSALSDAQAAAHDVRRLPTSLQEALVELAADGTVCATLGDYLLEAVTTVRSGEIAAMHGKDDEQVAAAYRWVY